MKTSLSYRITDDGENRFSKAVTEAKKWIGENINGPLRLKFIIQLKAIPPDDEDAAAINATEPIGFPKKRGKKSEEAEDLTE